MLPSKTSMLQRQVKELESENADLKIHLMEAQALIGSLAQENQALSKRLINYKGNTIITSNSTFITNTCSIAVCENCNQEVPQENIDLHLVQCLRRITRCKVCNEPLTDLELHLRSQIGNIEDIILDIESGNIQSLDSRFAHGARIDTLDDNANNLLHIASKSGKREMVQYFLSKGLDINAINEFGETPLHLVCGKFKDFYMVQFLINKGSDFRLTNSLGDSCMEVAKRNGFHEAVIYFQQKGLKSPRPSTTAGNSRMQKIKYSQNDSKFEL